MKRSIVILLTLVVARASFAQQDPPRERGFRADQVYQFNGFDSVNLFNGNLNLTLLLGQSYPVAAGLSYSFVLRYSGNVWKTREHCPPKDPENCSIWYTAQPSDNAGMGWRLSFSELRAPSATALPKTALSMWEYKAGDASEHLFYETLHEPKCGGPIQSNCELATPDVFYTRDGTYLRMKTAVDGAKVIEFGDGQRHRFVLAGTKWRLQYIYSTASTLNTNGVPTTNYVYFDYVVSDTYPNETDWKITDSHGREHRVYFQGGETVDKVELAAFRRSGDPEHVTARYNLSYGAYGFDANDEPIDGPSPGIKRPCDAGNDDAPTSFRFLSRVDLPSGEQYEFAYHQPTAACHDSSATLTEATLPTLGRIAWTYQAYGFASSPWIGATYATGVKDRTVKDADGTIIQKTTYDVLSPAEDAHDVVVRACGAFSATSCTAARKTVNHFTTSDGSFGLPVSPTHNDGSDPVRLRATQTFACNGTCETTPKRSTFQRFELDAVPLSSNCFLHYPCSRDRNRRVVSERIVYDQDDRHADTNHSLFDGLGHYRKTETADDFPYPTSRIMETNYNSHSRNGGSVGVYALAPDGSRLTGFAMLNVTDAWVLGTYGNSYVQENGVRTDIAACFDTAKGFLKAQRTVATTALGSHDLLAVFTRDTTTGFVQREEFFGGDEQNLPLTNDVCTLTPPAHDQYSFRLDHTYDYGALKTSRYMKADGTAMPFLSLNNTIDRNTALVASSTDPAGVSTTFLYDRAGRVEKMTPQAGGLTETVYSFVEAGADTPASVTVTAGTEDPLKTSMKYEFDGNGRLWREHHLMPDNSWSMIETLYDTLGRRSSVSEKEKITGPDFAPVNKTLFTSYDIFGRVGNIKAPDQQETTITYEGDWLTTRSVGVKTSDGVVSAVTKEEQDRAGRMRRVTENGTDETVYAYDPHRRLTTVTMGSQPARVFTYDGRGFLVSEQHPESGTTTYEYDARGHVVKRIGEVATLTTEYDRAERVIAVTGDEGILKQFVYDRPNFQASSTDYSMGKLAEATRHNYSDALGDVMIKEKYTYAEKQGLLSRKDTSITTVKGSVTTAGEHLYDTYEYDELGAVTKVGYPRCDPACPGTAAPVRTITTTVEHGAVTNVAPYTNSIAYHPNGLLHQVRHADADGSNGPLYQQSIVNGMARPYEITVEEYCDETNLKIQTQPVSGVVNSGAPANRSVTAPGAVQWQWYRISGSTNIIESDQTTNLLTTTVTQETKFWVRVSNGTCSIDSEIVTVSVIACATPSAAITVSPTPVQRNGSGTASVPSSTGASYSWSIQGGGTITSTTNGPSIDFSVNCTGQPVTLQVTVTASCGESNTGSKAVSIGPAPAVTLTPEDSLPLHPGEAKRLDVVIGGLSAPQWTIQWQDTASSETTETSFSRHVQPTVTTNYTITVAPAGWSCPPAVSNLVQVIVAPPPPTGVVATATAATQVNVSWNFSGDATEFSIQRRGAGGPNFAQIGTATAAARSFDDVTVAVDKAYLYRVVAVKNGTSSLPSGIDLATTMIFSPPNVGVQTEVRAQHITDLRTAVKAVRALWTSTVVTFTDPTLTPNVYLKVAHILELRSVLDQARANLGLPAVQYAPPPPAPQEVPMTTHINDLRGGVR